MFGTLVADGSCIYVKRALFGHIDGQTASFSGAIGNRSILTLEAARHWFGHAVRGRKGARG